MPRVRVSPLGPKPHTPAERGGVGFCFLWRDSNHLNGTVRWTVPCRQLDGANSLISRVSPLGHPRSRGGSDFVSFWRDSNHLNGTVRRTVPWRQLDGGNSLISRVSPLGHPRSRGSVGVCFLMELIFLLSLFPKNCVIIVILRRWGGTV